MAIYNVAWIYHKGYTVKMDRKKSLEYFQKASEMGNGYAICL